MGKRDSPLSASDDGSGGSSDERSTKKRRSRDKSAKKSSRKRSASRKEGKVKDERDKKRKRRRKDKSKHKERGRGDSELEGSPVVEVAGLGVSTAPQLTATQQAAARIAAIRAEEEARLSRLPPSPSPERAPLIRIGEPYTVHQWIPK